MVDWGQVIGITVTGLAVVFIALLLLIVIIWLMGKISQGLNKKDKPKKETLKKQTKPTKTNVVKSEGSNGIDSQTVAVIIAAISASMGSDNFVIKSVKRTKSNRSAWNQAGVLQNTNPF